MHCDELGNEIIEEHKHSPFVADRRELRSAGIDIGSSHDTSRCDVLRRMVHEGVWIAELSDEADQPALSNGLARASKYLTDTSAREWCHPVKSFPIPCVIAISIQV